MPTGEPRAKGRKQNYTRRKLEFEMLWYVWSTKTKQEVFKLLDSRRSCSDYATSRPKREKRNGVMDVDPRIDWAWAKFPKFRTLWNALEVDLRVAVEGTTKCIDGDIRPLLLLLPVQLIKLVYLYKYKIARCTSTFMHRVRYWFKEFGEGQSLLKFIAANCRNLMNDALIEYVNSMIARILPNKSVKIDFLIQIAHGIIPLREAARSAGSRKKKKDIGET